jgi:putative inorganic carbon (hco3(-)) transporter
MVAVARGRRQERANSAALPESAWIGLLIGAFALYYVTPWLPLSLLTLVLCAVLCYVQLPLATSLVPLAMPFFMLPKHLGHLEFSLGETAIVLCCVAYVVGRTLQRRRWGTGLGSMVRWYVPASPLERALALFLVAATVATLTAHFRHVALREYRLVILEPIAYYVLALALLRDTRAMVRAVWAVAGAGLLVAVLGLGQYGLRPDTLTGAYWVGRTVHPLHLITSVYGSPNNLGLLLDRAIPSAVVLGLAVLATAQSRRAEGPAWPAYLAWLAIVPMAAALLLSDSRGGIITAMAVSIAAVLLWRGRRQPRLELAALGLVVLGAAAVLWKLRHGLSAIARMHVWLSALAMIRDHPLLGVGPDNFLYYYVNPRAIDPHNPAASNCPALPRVLPGPHYLDLRNAWQEPCLSHPHNVVLDTWLSTGLIGLIALALVLVGFAMLARRNLRVCGAGWPRAVQVACCAIVLATLVHGLVDNSIFVPDLAVAFWLALALTSTVASSDGVVPPVPRPR